MNYNNSKVSQAEALLWVSLFYNPKNSISKDGSNKITESADKVTNTTTSKTLGCYNGKSWNNSKIPLQTAVEDSVILSV